VRAARVKGLRPCRGFKSTERIQRSVVARVAQAKGAQSGPQDLRASPTSCNRQEATNVQAPTSHHNRFTLNAACAPRHRQPILARHKAVRAAGTRQVNMNARLSVTDFVEPARLLHAYKWNFDGDTITIRNKVPECPNQVGIVFNVSESLKVHRHTEAARNHDRRSFGR
jgi:hypothetical protein